LVRLAKVVLVQSKVGTRKPDCLRMHNFFKTQLS
jgi:hypothetical protein